MLALDERDARTAVPLRTFLAVHGKRPEPAKVAAMVQQRLSQAGGGKGEGGR